jgi:putative glutamine amidotransferase
MERSHGSFHLYGIASTYTTAVETAGGIPVVIPPQQGNVAQLAGIVDGLIFSGGGDIDPAAYGDTETHPQTYGIHAGRDALEFGLLREAIEREIPTLCICRGIQVLNVFLEGTLYQDVADQYSVDVEHRQQTEQIAKEDPSHSVDVITGSLLADVYGSTQIEVNSFHHQGIKQIGRGLVAIAVSADGLVESVELPDHPWLLGVQWHPEMMFAAHDEHLKPFQGLVQAAMREVAVLA